MPRKSKLLWTWAVGLSLAGACGGGSASSSTLEFTEADARVFDDGVDFVSSVLALEGPWQEQWKEEVQQRSSRADGIALVEVHTLRTDTDPHGRVTHRLVVDRGRVIAGEVPQGELQLTTGQGSAGFRTVHSHLEQLQGERFVAYLKWYVNESGDRDVHWHLSPDSQEVVAASARLAGSSSSSGDREIVHEHHD